MSASTELLTQPPVVYPDSDGEPMADNTLQFQWIVTVEGNLETLYLHRPDVFVAGDLLWYPVEGHPTIRIAPDALVVFGRRKGHRGSYRQWEEGGIPPQVVFEILSPGDTPAELERKRLFYERYGVEECYYLGPEHGRAQGWVRREGALIPIPEMNGWRSPRLGIRFQVEDGEIILFSPDGQRFRTWTELAQERERERQRAEAERQRAEAERQRADRLAERLRALGVDPDSPGE